MSKRCEVVIIGGGPAGISAAIWCRRLGLDHLLIESSAELGGQLNLIFNPIIDYPGCMAADGRELKRKFVAQVQEMNCPHHVQAQVEMVDLERKRMRVRMPEVGVTDIEFAGLILATGCSERRLGVPGEREMVRRGEVYSASRDRERFRDRPVAFIGGGDRAFEGALLLAQSGAEVVLIHRSSRFKARRTYLNPVLAHERVRVMTGSTVLRIRGRDRVRGLTVRTREGTVLELAVDAVFVRIGVEPNIDLVRGQVELCHDGFVRVNEVGQTSVDGVFAVGDLCTRPVYSSIASAVGQGMVAAKHLSLSLQVSHKEELV